MIIKQGHARENGVFLITENSYEEHRNAPFQQDGVMRIDPALYTQGPEQLAHFRQEKNLSPEQEAYERGLNEGYQKGLQEERARWTHEFNERERDCLELATRLETWCMNLERDKQLFFRETTSGLLNTVMAIAETIIGETAKGSVKAVEFVLEKAFEKVHEKTVNTIRIHPNDRARLVAYNPEIVTRIQEIPSIEWQDDPALAEGSIQLVTDTGLIDASIKAQMREVHDYMSKIRESEGYDD